MDGDIIRVTNLIKNLHGYLSSVEVVMEAGGTMDHKLYRLLFGENRKEGSPDAYIRRLLPDAEGSCRHSVFDVPNRSFKPKEDSALYHALTAGPAKAILVAGWDITGVVFPSVADLVAKCRKGQTVTVISNCISDEDPAATEDFLGYCEAHRIQCTPTSEIVREAWKQAPL